MFQKPEVYKNNNNLQQSISRRVLQEYRPWLESRSGERVLDIGSGVGDTTTTILQPCLHPNFHSLIGVDVSKAMVDFAGGENSDPRVSYRLLDIAVEEDGLKTVFSDQELLLGFDKIFSFFCLHWTGDQRQSVRNISQLLRPGGQALVVFVSYSVFFKLWEDLREIKKWKQYLQDAPNVGERFPFFNSPTPDQDFSRLLTAEGLLIHECKNLTGMLEIDLEKVNVIDMVRPLDINLPLIPEALKEEYLRDFEKLAFEFRKEGSTLHLDGGAVVVAVFSKPLSP